MKLFFLFVNNKTNIMANNYSYLGSTEIGFPFQNIEDDEFTYLFSNENLSKS